MRVNINENIIFSEGHKMDSSSFWTQKSLKVIRYFWMVAFPPHALQGCDVHQSICHELAMLRSKILAARKVTRLPQLPRCEQKQKLASWFHMLRLQRAEWGGESQMSSKLCAWFRGDSTLSCSAWMNFLMLKFNLG